MTSFEQSCLELAEHFHLECDEVRQRVLMTLNMTGDGSGDRWKVERITESIAHLVKLTGRWKGPREFELCEDGRQWDPISEAMMPMRTIVHNQQPRESTRMVFHSRISSRNKA